MAKINTTLSQMEQSHQRFSTIYEAMQASDRSDFNFNETSIEYCLGAASPSPSGQNEIMFQVGFPLLPNKPAQLARQKQKPDLILAESMVLVSGDSQLIDSFTNNQKVPPRNLTTIENCYFCQSLIVPHNEKFKSKKSLKGQLLFLAQNLKAQKQALTQELELTFNQFNKLIKNSREGLDKQLRNQVFQQLGGRDKKIIAQQESIKQLVKAVEQLKRENKSLVEMNKEYKKEINELSIEYRASQREVSNLRQSKKELEEKLIYKESCLIAGQNSENKKLSQTIQVLRKRLEQFIEKEQAHRLVRELPNQFDTSLITTVRSKNQSGGSQQILPTDSVYLGKKQSTNSNNSRSNDEQQLSKSKTQITGYQHDSIRVRSPTEVVIPKKTNFRSQVYSKQFQEKSFNQYPTENQETLEECDMSSLKTKKLILGAHEQSLKLVKQHRRSDSIPNTKEEEQAEEKQQIYQIKSKIQKLKMKLKSDMQKNV